MPQPSHRHRAPTPVSPARRGRVSLALAGLLVAAALGAGCSREDPLAPLADMARGAMAEAEQRIERARAFLGDDVMPHPEVAGLYAATPPPKPDPAQAITWSSTPYIAVGAFDAQGHLLMAMPRAGEDLAALLETAARGPDIGDLTRIPNTFAFTVGMRQLVPDHPGAYVSALLDVDDVLVDGVLYPVAEAAHGFAFLADGDHNVVLTTLPALTGRALAAWSIPVPGPGRQATATVTIDGRRYDVAAAGAKGPYGWVLGVGVSAAGEGPEKTPVPPPQAPGSTLRDAPGAGA